MDNKAIIIFRVPEKQLEKDLEIPLDITPGELIGALNKAYDLEIDTADVKNCYLKAEHPVALLRGSRKLSEFGVRTGTVIFYH